MTPDSRASTVDKDFEAHFLYSSTGRRGEKDEWIQPSIIYELIEPSEVGLINNIYAQTNPYEFSKLGGLESEFEAWEAASDEALKLFEEDLG